VVKVGLLSGKTLREPGASYQCHLSGGKHTCIEKNMEIIPPQKIVTVLQGDTFGIIKILSDYRSLSVNRDIPTTILYDSRKSIDDRGGPKVG